MRKDKYPEPPLSVANGEMQKAVKTLNEITEWLAAVATIELRRLRKEGKVKTK